MEDAESPAGFAQGVAKRSIEVSYAASRLSKAEICTDRVKQGHATNGEFSFMNLPTEILEKIALCMEPKDLLNLRLANYELSKKTADAFADKFLTNLKYTFHEENACQRTRDKIDGLKLRPDFAQRVKNLSTDCTPKYHALSNELVASVEILTSLCSLYFHSTREWYEYCLWKTGIRNFLRKVCIPHLERITIEHSWDFGFREVMDLAHRHRETLKILEFLAVTVKYDDKPDTQEWKQLLNLANSLRPETTLLLSAPQASLFVDEYNFGESARTRVSFTPSEDDEDAAAVRVQIGSHRGIKGLHYFSEPGNLQKSVTCMIRNYKELRTRKERLKSGALGRVYDSDEEIEASSDEDSWPDGDMDYFDYDDRDYIGSDDPYYWDD
jgi:hypothetical protein